MSTITIRDDKTVNNSGEDYLTLSNYYDSFYSAPRVSQLRMAIVPGTVKYFNKSFSAEALRSSTGNNPFGVTESALTLLPPKKNEDEYDYMSYPRLN